MCKIDDQDCITFAASMMEGSSIPEVCRLFNLIAKLKFRSKKLAIFVKKDTEFKEVFSSPKFRFSIPISIYSREAIRATESGLQIPLIKNQEIIGVILLGDIFDKKLISSNVFQYLIQSFTNKLESLSNRKNNSTELGDLECVEIKRRELETRNQLEKLKRFFARISHEIRTPLNSIIGLAEIIKNSKDEAEKEKCIEVISNSSNILLHLINEVLDLSKLNANSVKLENIPFNLYAEVKSVYDMFFFQPKKGVELKLNFQSEKNQNYLGDPGRLRQVLVNLVSNAMKFTETGHVEIYVKELLEGGLVFQVIDTGIGISYKNRTKIFDEFSQEYTSTTRKFGGTGLGLSICKLIVEMMNGRIWAGNNDIDGKGSIFKFRIDLEKYNGALNTKTQDTEKELSGVKTVMVVDDTPMNLFLMKKVFSETPFQVAYYEGGKEAIEAFKKDDFDLILMDLQMPEMSGQETTEFLRAIEKQKGRTNTKIYALTADVYASMDQLYNYGFDGIFTKPLNREKLFNSIDSNS